MKAARQDYHDLKISFTTAGQKWINGQTRTDDHGHSLEPVFDSEGESLAKFTITRRNPPDHEFFIMQIQVSIYKNRCVLKHFYEKKVIGEMVFLGNTDKIVNI